MEVTKGDGLKQRNCCSKFSCTKTDFLPEPSFQDWSSYLKALGQTGTRFRDRITARSPEDYELHEVRARSGHEMKKSLTWWDLCWFGIGAVIGSGIFVLTGQEARNVVGPAVVLSYVVSGISAMLSVFCYTEFAVEIPSAGMSFLLDLNCASSGFSNLFIGVFCLTLRTE
jgi:basic amino acid/polyamine antiporter, APA family